MRRIYAASYIAAMKHVHSFWYGSIFLLPGYSMCIHPTYVSVAVLGYRPKPNETTREWNTHYIMVWSVGHSLVSLLTSIPPMPDRHRPCFPSRASPSPTARR